MKDKPIPPGDEPPITKPTSCTNKFYFKTIEYTGQIYAVQKGHFPVTYSHSNKYLMVLYNYDSNAILAEPMKSHSEAKIVRAYSKLHAYLTNRGLKPVLQKIDNKAPEGPKQFM